MIVKYSVMQQDTPKDYAALCEVNEDGLQLLRLMGQTAYVVFPQQIDGYEVRSIGKYCFAAKRDCNNRTSDNEWEELEHIAVADGMHELSGEYIENVVLPDSVNILESYAFYNCRKLNYLEFGSGLNVVNNDAFMNCRELSVLAVRSDVEAATGVQYFLKQLNKGIELKFVKNSDIVGSFYYSEYTESYEEIGPAHIFQMDVQGEGYRTRQLFNDGVVDAVRYDAVFDAAKALESIYTLSKMAVGRLQYPVKLADEARTAYTQFLKGNIENVLEWIVKEQRIDIIESFVQENILDEKGLDTALKLAGKCGWTAGSASIIELGSRFAQKMKKSRYEF